MKIAILALGLLAFAFVATVAPAHVQGAKDNTTLTGCLSGPNGEGNFVLQTSSGNLELTGSSDLKNHVGHQIKVTGKSVSEAQEEKNEAGENKAEEQRENPAQEQKEKREEANEKHLKVSKIQIISDTCTTK